MTEFLEWAWQHPIYFLLLFFVGVPISIVGAKLLMVFIFGVLAAGIVAIVKSFLWIRQTVRRLRWEAK